jgi:hypothetical protein
MFFASFACASMTTHSASLMSNFFAGVGSDGTGLLCSTILSAYDLLGYRGHYTHPQIVKDSLGVLEESEESLRSP